MVVAMDKNGTELPYSLEFLYAAALKGLANVEVPVAV